MNKFLRIILIIVLVGGGASAIWWKLSQNKATMEEQVQLTMEQATAVPVRVAAVTREAFRDRFTVNGAFEPSQELVVVSTVNGQIVESNIQPGTYVRKGGLMIVVDSQYTRNELEAVELNLAQAEKNLERMSNLIGDGGITQQQYEEVKVKVESGKIQLQSLRKRLQDSYIRAPLSGTVTMLPQSQEPMVGAFVGQGKPICQIVNVERMRLRVLLTEEQIVRIRKGQSVIVTADVYPGTQYQGTVRYLGIKTDFLSKRYPVDIEVVNSREHPLRGGMNGHARFETEERIASLVVPRQAFAGSVRDGRIYVIDGSLAREKTVETGETLGDQVEILAGLQEGDQVVVTGQINLQDSTRITIVE